MRGMVELAQDQFGGLSFGDRLIAAGTVSNHFIGWRFRFGFEQRFLQIHPG
jgi:hypothetical protein